MEEKELKQKIKAELQQEIKNIFNNDVVIRNYMIGNPRIREQAFLNNFLVDQIVELKHEIKTLHQKQENQNILVEDLRKLCLAK